MGLFDYLKCEYPLPFTDDQGELIGWNLRQNDFQANDFDCLVAEYRIPRRCKMSSFSEPEKD